MSDVIAFEVVGQPVPQGSLRSLVTPQGKVNSMSDPKLARYRADIRAIALDVMRERTLMAWAVRMDISFVLSRPAYHFHPVNSKRTEPEVKPGASAFPFGPPDLDKLCRSVLDALTGIVYADDAQVISLHGRKDWSDEPAFGGLTHITITGGNGP